MRVLCYNTVEILRIISQKGHKKLEKIGIIDLGSNTARLVIVDIYDDGHFWVVDELKESVRLGQDMERDGFLKPQRVAETIKTLKMFRKLCDSYHIERIIAVATAAVRRAKNQRSFLDEVAAICGIKLKVLTEEEEAMYVYKGIINSMDIPKGVIMEIGGGSTKIIYYNRRNLLGYVNLPFGAVTLTDLFAYDGLAPQEQAQKIEEFFTEQLKQIDWLSTVDPEAQLIGAGGSFRNLCRLSKIVHKYPLDTVHNYNVPEDDFNNIYNMLKVLDLDKKKKIKGISAQRADILPAAMAVMSSFIKYMNFHNIVISANGLREGIMFNYAMPITIEKPITDVLGYSLGALTTTYGCDSKHTEQVVNLSVQLFKQLRVLHKFPRQYLKILKVAATLHDAGLRLKYYNHQKHSWYAILNATLYGITHRELVLAAFVASCHKKEEIQPSDWVRFKDIVTEEDFDAVKKLGVMLRIAESLDRSLSSAVIGINCDVLGDSVIMKTEVDGDASLEIKDALSAGGEFRRAFKKNLEIL